MSNIAPLDEYRIEAAAAFVELLVRFRTLSVKAVFYGPVREVMESAASTSFDPVIPPPPPPPPPPPSPPPSPPLLQQPVGVPKDEMVLAGVIKSLRG